MEMQEKILCAAINFNGVIICGHRHSNCYELIDALIGQWGLVSVDMPDRDKQGFLTSENRFVDRKEAWAIADKNNQIVYGKVVSENGQESILISENLY